VARERTLEEVTEELEKLWREFQRLADRFDTAPFVRAELHNEQIAHIRDDLGGLKTMLMWILGILGSVLVAGVVALITAVAQGGLG
jgi:hypothetical protein